MDFPYLTLVAEKDHEKLPDKRFSFPTPVRAHMGFVDKEGEI